MADQSSPLLPHAEESIEAETGTALEPELELGEPTPDASSEPGFVCACGGWRSPPCKGLPFYKEHESRRYCVLHYPGKEKSPDFKVAVDSKLNKGDFDFRNVWFPYEVDFSGFEFGMDADFSSATFSAGARFYSATFSRGASFSDVTFSAAADFRSATFRADAYFGSARFSAAGDFIFATFSAAADFRSATFRADAYFGFATFSGAAYFSSAIFNSVADFSGARLRADAYFSSATFSAKADFTFATFSDANFNLSVFHARADFSHTSFNDTLYFFGSLKERILNDGTSLPSMALGKDPSLDFQHARIEQPQRVSFHTLNLRPHWFVNVDPRQFVFTDVGWEWERISIKEEIAALEAKVASPVRLLAIACRQLAENAEDNNRYEEASNFRYWAMELQRTIYSLQWQERRARKRMKWKLWWKRWNVSRSLTASRSWMISKRRWRKRWVDLQSLGVTLLHSIYWVVSGYGERISNAVLTLSLTWLLFALMYVSAGLNEQISFPRALTYSLAVMSLQKPELRPLTTWAHTLVTFETILGPVQAALLALAIRRKFMR